MSSLGKQLADRIERGNHIPEEIQEPMRKRLRMLRQSRTVAVKDIDNTEFKLSSSTLTQYEVNDISTMQVYHFYAVAQWLNVPFGELMDYLFNPQEDSGLHQRDDNSMRMSRLIGNLDEHDQQVALALVDVLVESRGKYTSTVQGGHSRARRRGIPYRNP